MIDILIYIIVALAAVVVILELLAHKRNAAVDLPRLWQTLETLEKSAQHLDRSVREELAKLRDESAAAARQAREENTAALKSLSDTLRQDFAQLQQTVSKELQAQTVKLTALQTEVTGAAKAQRDEVTKALTGFQETLTKHLADAAKSRQAQIDDLAGRLEKLAGATDQKVAAAQAETAKQVAGLDAKLQSLHSALQQTGDRLAKAIASLPAPPPLKQ